MDNHELYTPRIYTKHGFTKESVGAKDRTLDVGCGGRKLPGSTGMDILSLPGVDVVHDFNQTPWPFADNAFEIVFLNHALEHVSSVIDVMNEIHRVLVPGGRVIVQVPYFRCVDAFTDPTHTHFFTSKTLDYFIQDSGLARYAYSDKLFSKKGFWYGWPHESNNPLTRAFKKYVYANQGFYDQYLSLLIPTECLTWELEVVK